MTLTSRSFDKTKFAVKRIIFTTVLICLFTNNSSAQTGASNQKPQPCPTIKFVNPPYEVESGKSVTLAIKVSGSDPNASFTYNWMVSDGALSAGQGTEKVELDTTEAQGETITATVEIGGLAPECNRTRSHTVEVKRKPKALKIYEGKYVNKADLEKQLDELILARQATVRKGYIIFYAGRKAPTTEVKRLTAVAKAQIKKRNEDASLFIILDGGTRDETFFELWTAAEGADPPQPSPKK